MKVNGVTQWIVIDYKGSSLFNVISDDVYKNTTVGKDLWPSLMDNSLLDQCCDEGFNLQRQGKSSAYVRVRIGLVAHCESNCKFCRSGIGFGTSILSCNGDLKSASCGISKGRCNDGVRPIIQAAFGYILVQ